MSPAFANPLSQDQSDLSSPILQTTLPTPIPATLLMTHLQFPWGDCYLTNKFIPARVLPSVNLPAEQNKLMATISAAKTGNLVYPPPDPQNPQQTQPRLRNTDLPPNSMGPVGGIAAQTTSTQLSSVSASPYPARSLHLVFAQFNHSPAASFTYFCTALSPTIPATTYFKPLANSASASFLASCSHSPQQQNNSRHHRSATASNNTATATTTTTQQQQQQQQQQAHQQLQAQQQQTLHLQQQQQPPHHLQQQSQGGSNRLAHPQSQMHTSKLPEIDEARCSA
ncbi:hypothetical protein PGT21_000192 [Puccinia graminis f. sp. tritici]|uniref:Uncharacterized protein n=1 Tax=Puccinia graminis f. sp. tritici TaxID=56615 RepID=A0A5B0MRC2_PUCGR|nr:hypothetical protein PGT21_000192 [Puccinia graminis f. sp. tritici]